MAAVGTTATSYEILTKLAEGGMAEIYLARSTLGGTQHFVVVKRIAKSKATDTQYVQMFLDEARLASQLRHPNIAQVFDIGRLGTSYFFTMEYVHGATVQDLVNAARDRKTPIPIGAVLAIVGGTAAGLEHAHERRGLDGKPLGIVHRDVSPSNLIVSYDGHLKIVDFGVAKAMGRPETQAGEIKGKVGYLSPEQCRMQKIDRRSDLYSLGVVAWEMLTLQRLWQRETAFGTLAAIATEVPPPPSKFRPDVFADVDSLVRRLLTLDPADRFQSAQAVVEAVEQVAQRTMSSMTPQQLSRMMHNTFGVRPEPWHALDLEEAVSVTATPLPQEESLDTFDDEKSASEIDVKLTSIYRAVTTEDHSATNVLAVRAPEPPDDETREVPALARATSIGDAPPLTPPPVVVPRSSARDVTLRDPKGELRSQLPLLPPAPEQTILGAGEPRAPTRLSQPPPPNRPPTSPPLGRGSARTSSESQPPPSQPIPRTSSPSHPPPLGSGPLPLSGSGGRLAPTPPTAPFTPPEPAPTAPLEAVSPSGPQGTILGSGPRPSLRDRGSGSSAAYPPAAQQIALPRYPPPPHGSRSSLHWWVIGGATLGVGIMILILASRSEPRAVAFDDTDNVRIVATTPDAAAVATDAAIAVAVADAAPLVADAATAPADAETDDLEELEQMAKKPMPPPKPQLRTKPELNAAFRQRRYTEIVAACVELGADGERAVVCTLAACRARDAKAQEWYRNVVPKQREGTIRICADAGHTITDVCATDLLACRK